MFVFKLHKQYMNVTSGMTGPSRMYADSFILSSVGSREVLTSCMTSLQ